MFDHLFNCHGEGHALLALIDSWPWLGAWLRSKLSLNKNDEKKETCP